MDEILYAILLNTQYDNMNEMNFKISEWFSDQLN